MNEIPVSLVQPFAYRVWDPKHRSFFHTDVQPHPAQLVHRWTGLFDKQGWPLYEQDIIRVHYDWKFGWVRALVMRKAGSPQYTARATTTDGAVLHIGYYCFADSYRVGNLREHLGKLVSATPQFAEHETEPSWLSRAVFRPSSGPCFN